MLIADIVVICGKCKAILSRWYHIHKNGTDICVNVWMDGQPKNIMPHNATAALNRSFNVLFSRFRRTWETYVDLGWISASLKIHLSMSADLTEATLWVTTGHRGAYARAQILYTEGNLYWRDAWMRMKVDLYEYALSVCPIWMGAGLL